MQYIRNKKTPPTSVDSNYRWWESYLVRYAIGSVVGALFVYAILSAIGGDVMNKALMIPTVSKDQLNILMRACENSNANACVAHLQLYQDLYGFNLPQLALLGIYGFGYCYVASSPGLVVHAVRRHLASGGNRPLLRKDWLMAGLAIASVLIPLVVLLCSGAVAAAWVTLITAGILVLVQIALLFVEYHQGNVVLQFYEQLHRTRLYPKITLDSYRHLREHGNAFFIVVLELMFFSVAMSMLKIFGHHPYWPILLILWVVPGAAVYFLGHRIEALLREKYGGR